MTDTPWLGDACSLVDAYRRGERSPADELAATLGAIGDSELSALPFLDADAARATAAAADVSLPFGGVPIGVKELHPVAGWPYTEASLVFADRVADYTATMVGRLEAAGVVKVGQTTSSEFGGLKVGVTRLHGVTHNPWGLGRTPGGSSGGSAAAVAGGLVPLATGSDGGGSIRIPAGFCGLVGMKGTAGRIPRGPHTEIAPLTVVAGCLARSVRDVARSYDVRAGYDARDPYSLPRSEGGDGGGSIRSPAGFCGLVGMKGTAGRIPRGPHTEIAPLTVVAGCLARSVRDVARWYDVCAGYDARDPYSLPRIEGWERDLGSHDLRGRTAVIAPDLGNAVVRPEVAASVREAGEALARAAGLRLVDVPVRLPGLGFEWAMSNLAQLRRELGDAWPACKEEMTLEMAFGMDLADKVFDLSLAATCEHQRTQANEAMAAVFD